MAKMLDATHCRPRRVEKAEIAEEFVRKNALWKKTYMQKARTESPVFAEIGKRYSKEIFEHVYWNATRGEKEKFVKDGVPTIEGIKEIDKLFREEMQNIVWTPSGFMKFLYLPESLMKHHPASNTYFDKQQGSFNAKQGNTNFFNRELAIVNKWLQEAAYAQSKKDKGILDSPTKVFDELNERYATHRKLVKDGKSAEAQTYMQENIVEHLYDGEGKVLKDFHYLINMNKKEFSDWDSGKLIKEKNIHGNVFKAAQTWHNTIQPKAQTLIDKSINNLLYGLKNANEIYRGYGDHKESIRQLENSKKLIRDKKLTVGINFSALTLDFLPQIAESQKYLMHGKSEADYSKGVRVLERIPEIIKNNISTYHKLASKSPEHAKALDLDSLVLMGDFAQQVTRANFVSYNTKIAMEALRDLGKPNQGVEGLDEKIAFLQQVIGDTYSRNIGGDALHSQLAGQTARFITSVQFVSKMGLGFRPAVRNATQSLQHYVYFGYQATKEAQDIYNSDPQMKKFIDSALRDRGLELGEGMGELFELGEQGHYNQEKGMFESRFDHNWYTNMMKRAGNKAVELSGKPMRWVENKWNRNTAFKIGFMMQWKADGHRKTDVENRFKGRINKTRVKDWLGETFDSKKTTKDELIQQLKDSVTEVGPEKSTEYLKRLQEYRIKRAGDKGEWAVGKVHYWYNKSAKPGALANPYGAVLGQFQTYGVNFFRYNYDIIKGGKDDVLAKEWMGEGAQRMYRLGFMYTVLSGILSFATNSDFSNLMPHDTVEKIQNFADGIADDEDKNAKAFYGKGPLVGTIGGPFVSDLVTIGNVFNLYDLDEDGWAGYLAGYQDLSSLDNPGKLEQMVRVANVQAHRTLYNTIPKWKAGTGIGSIIQSELGLLPTESVRDLRKATVPYTKPEKRIAPTKVPTSTEAILQSLGALEKEK